MARGWWKLEITDIEDLSDLTDIEREHIAAMIIDGCWEGEIVQEEQEFETKEKP
jgi:hypothetical protein